MLPDLASQLQSPRLLDHKELSVFDRRKASHQQTVTSAEVIQNFSKDPKLFRKLVDEVSR